MSATNIFNNIISQISGKLPLRTMIVIPFVVLVALAGGTTGYLSLRNGQDAVNDVASQLRTEVAARIEERVKSYLDKAHLVNELHANTITLEQLNLQDNKELQQHFWKQVQPFSQVTNTFIGLPSGDFVGASRRTEGVPQIILADETTKGSLTYYNTNSRGDSGKAVDSAPNYDPRVRDWYIDAVKRGKPIWSDIYPEFTTGALAITAAQPVYENGNSEKLLGVLGTTAIFTQVDEFLASLKIGETGQTFIMERSTGTLVTTSTNSPVMAKDVNDKMLRLRATDSEDQRIQATATFLKQTFGGFSHINGGQQLEFQINGESQFVQVSPLQDGRGLDWLIVIVVPESDFMGQINANTRMTVYMSIIALMLTTLIGLATARGIIQPILTLNNAAKKFAGGDWDQKLPIERTDELGDLAKSFNSMGGQVKKAFHDLEDVNANLEHRVAERTEELSEAYHELKASQAQLVQSEKMASLGQMVAGVAHEINTPLGYVRSNVEMTQGVFQETQQFVSEYDSLVGMLMSENVGEDELNEQLQIVTELSEEFRDNDTFSDAYSLFSDVLKGLDRIADLVLNLKDFSRVDSVKVRDVNLNECLDSALVIGNHILKEVATIDKKYAEGLPSIQCSPSHLNQVFLNIVTNAAQSMDRGGKITLTTYADDDWVNVEIIDNGKGIPEDVKSKIFDPFFTTKPVGEGTGLGLSISYQIIEQHEGKIEVDSEEGKGTTFKISLPRQIS
ncbi:MAG: ATP-binding protein [Thiotrichaceae bacterium]|nr:ATP-binding protein [Thiotrichaceae bacterium]